MKPPQEVSSAAQQQRPSKGRIVFVQEGERELVGIVTGVKDDTTIQAWIFEPEGLRAGNRGAWIEYDAKPAGRILSWHWPPRV